MYKFYVRLALLFFSAVLNSAAVFAQDSSVADDVRDPTTPLGHAEVFHSGEKELALELHSVLVSTQRKLAIINGVSLREGQAIPGANGITIQRILPQKVLLRQGDKVWAISLSPNIRH